MNKKKCNDDELTELKKELLEELSDVVAICNIMFADALINSGDIKLILYWEKKSLQIMKLAEKIKKL